MLKKRFRKSLSPLSIEFIERYLSEIDREARQEIGIRYCDSSVSQHEKMLSLAYCTCHRAEGAASWAGLAICGNLVDSIKPADRDRKQVQHQIRIVRACRRKCRSREAAAYLRLTMACLGNADAQRALVNDLNPSYRVFTGFTVIALRRLGTGSAHRSLARIGHRSSCIGTRIYAAINLVFLGCRPGRLILQRERQRVSNPSDIARILVGLAWSGDIESLDEIERITITESDAKVLELYFREMYSFVLRSPPNSNVFRGILPTLEKKIDSSNLAEMKVRMQESAKWKPT